MNKLTTIVADKGNVTLVISDKKHTNQERPTVVHKCKENMTKGIVNKYANHFFGNNCESQEKN